MPAIDLSKATPRKLRRYVRVLARRLELVIAAERSFDREMTLDAMFTLHAEAARAARTASRFVWPARG